MIGLAFTIRKLPRAGGNEKSIQPVPRKRNIGEDIRVVTPHDFFGNPAGRDFEHLVGGFERRGDHPEYGKEKNEATQIHSAIVPLAVLWVARKLRNISIVGYLAVTFATGFLSGVGIHLVTDVFQTAPVKFPFIGSLVDGTSIVRLLILAAARRPRRPSPATPRHLTAPDIPASRGYCTIL